MNMHEFNHNNNTYPTILDFTADMLWNMENHQTKNGFTRDKDTIKQ